MREDLRGVVGADPAGLEVAVDVAVDFSDAGEVPDAETERFDWDFLCAAE